MKQVSMNFGVIKDTVYRYAGKSLVNEDNTQISLINAFLNEIKKNPLLKKQYLIYKNFEEGYCKKENLAERFINQNLKLLEGYNWRQIVETNKDIRYSLLEQSHVEGQKGKEELYEAINTLIKSVTQEGYVEIGKSQDAYDTIVQHLMTAKPESQKTSETVEEEYPKFLSWKFVTELAVNNFNERYSHLNESEKELLKMLLSTEENKKNSFIDLKKESLEKLNYVLSKYDTTVVQDSFGKFVEKINNMNENELTGSDLDEAIIHLYELQDLIMEQE